jgi:hypothetical protein
MDIKKQDYNINKLQADLTKKSIEEGAKTPEDGSQNGAAGENGSQDIPPQDSSGGENPAPLPN